MKLFFSLFGSLAISMIITILFSDYSFNYPLFIGSTIVFMGIIYVIFTLVINQNNFIASEKDIEEEPAVDWNTILKEEELQERLDTFEEKAEEKEIKDKKKSFVYLMKNDRGHHKIGKSNNPNSRLSNLRSGDPSIELVSTKELASETDAIIFESFLHDLYSEYNIALEWFKLPEAKLSSLKQFLD
jgi:predicted GIY-YIG superfamily endonuclease